MVFVLPGWCHVMRFRMMLFRVCDYSGSDRGTDGPSHDGTVAATDFIAYGRASGSANAPAYRGIKGRIPRVRRGSE